MFDFCEGTQNGNSTAMPIEQILLLHNISAACGDNRYASNKITICKLGQQRCGSYPNSIPISADSSVFTDTMGRDLPVGRNAKALGLTPYLMACSANIAERACLQIRIQRTHWLP